ncbi:MAG TPA: phage portal protein [Allosphingosinicella sp.]|jgi:HK97 family phage portal protein
MKVLGFDIRRSAPAAETRANIEDPTVSVGASDFLGFFGVGGVNLPSVTIDSALTVPAVLCAATFIPGALANLPLHLFKVVDDAPVKAGGPLQRILNEAPNGEWSSFAARKYFWQQVFTGGRGLMWIERAGTQVVGLWPIDPAGVSMRAVNGVRTYQIGGRTYASSEIVDIAFFLKRDQISHFGPIALGSKAIAVALAMGDYAGSFFAGGGVPPLSVSGPMPTGVEAQKRAYSDIQRAIDVARESGKPIVQLPTGYELKPIGFDPAKGQMTEARLFQIQEIARVYNLPPAFLHELSRGTFANVEQQDLVVVKHLIAHWAKALEDELNLKLFGAKRNVRYVEHNLDGIMRGDFKTRLEALARGVQTALLTPDEGRDLLNRPPKPGGDKLYIQSATVPIEMAGKVQVKPAANDAGDKPDGEEDDGGSQPQD